MVLSEENKCYASQKEANRRRFENSFFFLFSFLFRSCKCMGLQTYLWITVMIDRRYSTFGVLGKGHDDEDEGNGNGNWKEIVLVER